MQEPSGSRKASHFFIYRGLASCLMGIVLVKGGKVMNQFQLEDLRKDPKILEKIQKLESKIKKETGKDIALIAYTNK